MQSSSVTTGSTQDALSPTGLLDGSTQDVLLPTGLLDGHELPRIVNISHACDKIVGKLIANDGSVISTIAHDTKISFSDGRAVHCLYDPQSKKLTLDCEVTWEQYAHAHGNEYKTVYAKIYKLVETYTEYMRRLKPLEDRYAEMCKNGTPCRVPLGITVYRKACVDIKNKIDACFNNASVVRAESIAHVITPGIVTAIPYFYAPVIWIVHEIVNATPCDGVYGREVRVEIRR